MRAAIFSHLRANCPGVKGWYHPGAAKPGAARPYGVVMMSGEVRAPGGRFRDLVLSIYLDPDAYVAADAVAKQVKDSFRDGYGPREIPGPSGKFVVEWDRDNSDFYDANLGLLVYNIEFTIPIGG